MPYGTPDRGGDTYLTTVEWKDHTAVYLGGDVESTVPSLDDKVVVVLDKLYNGQPILKNSHNTLITFLYRCIQ